MKHSCKKIIPILSLMFLPLISLAQDHTPMADLMRSNGKIYVVVAVVLIIFIAILFFLFNLDKKIRRLEKRSE